MLVLRFINITKAMTVTNIVAVFLPTTLHYLQTFPESRKTSSNRIGTTHNTHSIQIRNQYDLQLPASPYLKNIKTIDIEEPLQALRPPLSFFFIAITLVRNRPNTDRKCVAENYLLYCRPEYHLACQCLKK